MSEEIKENIKAYYIGSDIDKVLDYIQQKENTINEVREYCMKYENWEDDCVNDIMKILGKENDREDK